MNISPFGLLPWLKKHGRRLIGIYLVGCKNFPEGTPQSHDNHPE
jgi:hypothetical protein